MSAMAENESRLKDVVVITGFSGAGKSTAMNVFEDAGYFCVDNLPPEMIRSLVELFMHEGSKVERAAVVSDVRGGIYFEALRAVVDDLDALGVAHHVLFLEAAEQTLVTRYKETRRRHPLAPEGSVAAGVASERALLEPLRSRPGDRHDGDVRVDAAREDRRRVPAQPDGREAGGDVHELRLQARASA
jgi:RNase adapter protein RapZ